MVLSETNLIHQVYFEHGTYEYDYDYDWYSHPTFLTIRCGVRISSGGGGV